MERSHSHRMRQIVDLDSLLTTLCNRMIERFSSRFHQGNSWVAMPELSQAPNLEPDPAEKWSCPVAADTYSGSASAAVAEWEPGSGRKSRGRNNP